MTARGANGLTVAVVEALCCDLPLALVCLWIARNIERRRPVASALVADHDST